MVNNIWETSTLGKRAKVYRGGSPRPIQAYLTNSSNGINWIKIGDVRVNDKYITSTAERIIPEGVTKSRRVYAGDLILSNSMSFGRPYILKLDGCIHDGWLTIQEYQDTFDVDFLYYLLSSEDVMKQYIAMAAGSSVKNLNKEKVSALVVTYPEKPEQIQIATALSDVDTLISDLEKLIIKKKNIRKGVMHELLTGKRRLPGFTEDWHEVNMAKNSKIKARIGWQGLTTAEYLTSGYSYLVTGTDFHEGKVNWQGCHYVTKDRYDQDTNIQLKNGDVLVTKDGTIGKIALVSDLNMPATLNSGVFVIRPINNVFTAHFLYYILQSQVFKSFIQELMAGSTITHLYQKDIDKFNFLAPVSLDEQNEIAAAIFDIDKEISILEKKLEKYQNIKQGMMQKLLTGEIRLI